MVIEAILCDPKKLIVSIKVKSEKSEKKAKRLSLFGNLTVSSIAA